MAVKTKTEYVVDDLDRSLHGTLGELRSQAVLLRDRLDKMIDRIDEHGIAASINALGELQGNGVELDRLCGILYAQRDTVRLLKQAQEPDTGNL